MVAPSFLKLLSFEMEAYTFKGELTKSWFCLPLPSMGVEAWVGVSMFSVCALAFGPLGIPPTASAASQR